MRIGLNKACVVMWRAMQSGEWHRPDAARVQRRTTLLPAAVDTQGL